MTANEQSPTDQELALKVLAGWGRLFNTVTPGPDQMSRLASSCQVSPHAIDQVQQIWNRVARSRGPDRQTIPRQDLLRALDTIRQAERNLRCRSIGQANLTSDTGILLPKDPDEPPEPDDAPPGGDLRPASRIRPPEHYGDAPAYPHPIVPASRQQPTDPSAGQEVPDYSHPSSNRIAPRRVNFRIPRPRRWWRALEDEDRYRWIFRAKVLSVFACLGGLLIVERTLGLTIALASPFIVAVAIVAVLLALFVLWLLCCVGAFGCTVYAIVLFAHHQNFKAVLFLWLAALLGSLAIWVAIRVEEL